MSVSLNQQIEEVERELALRKRLYPHFVASRKLQQRHADFYTERLRAVLETLERLRDANVETKPTG